MKDIQVDLSTPGEVNARMEKPAFLGTGPQGEPGKDGVSVTGLEISEGHLFCRLSNGYSIDAGEFPIPRHWQLSGLDVINQHPIGAIIGLNDALNGKLSNATFTVYYNAISDAINALAENKQDKTDDDLTTTDKTITGSINEIVDTIGLIVEYFGQSLNDTMSKPGEEVEANRVPVSDGDGRGGYTWKEYSEGTDEVWLPSVDTSGNISWTKSSSSTAPTTRNIKGATGERGNTISAGSSLPSAFGRKADDLFILLTDGNVYRCVVQSSGGSTSYSWQFTGYSIKGADGEDGLTTSVTVNGETIQQTDGDIDIGTVLRAHQDISGKADKPTIKTTMDSVAVVNTQYYLGTQTAVSISMPTTGISVGDEILVVFSSGTTAATLTCDLTEFDFTPKAGKTNKLVFTLINATSGSQKWMVETEES